MPKQLMVSSAKAPHYAHETAYPSGHIKPTNIMIDRQGASVKRLVRLLVMAVLAATCASRRLKACLLTSALDIFSLKLLFWRIGANGRHRQGRTHKESLDHITRPKISAQRRSRGSFVRCRLDAGAFSRVHATKGSLNRYKKL